MNIPKATWFMLGITVGAAGGIGGTYIYMKDSFEKRLNEEVNALKAHYVERDKKLADENEEKKKNLAGKIFTVKEENEFVDYSKMYQSQTEIVDVDKVAVTSYNEVVEENGDISAAAEIISDVEFSDPEYDNFRKITVDYFEDGAIFESLSGEELDGFEMIAGDDWKGSFGEYTPNVVYVRNHDLKTDYEIVEHEGSHPHPEDE